MARQEIILGTAPNGLGGDPPRTASTKINAMTAEIYGITNTLGTASKLNVMATPDSTFTGAYSVLKQGDYGIGRPLAVRSLPNGASNRADVLARGTGFSLDVISGGDKPTGVTDGPLLTLGYDSTQGFQICFDWVDGTIYTFPSASAAPSKKWFKQYHTGNIVGSVDAGAIIERGTNVNGDFTKYADGTLICFGSKNKGSVSIGTANGAVYNSALQSLGATGATFVGTPSILIQGVTSDSTVWVGTPTVGTGNFYFFATTPAIRECSIMYTVIGRWK